jgi:hypothetical protein
MLYQLSYLGTWTHKFRQMVLSQGIEPWTSSLPMKCSTPEL